MTKEIVVGKPLTKSKPQLALYKPRKESFISKALQVVIDDIKNLILRKELLINETPEGWEEYRRFCELAKGKK